MQIHCLEQNLSTWKQTGYWYDVDSYDYGKDRICCLYQQVIGREIQNPDQGIVSFSTYDLDQGEWKDGHYFTVWLPQRDEYKGTGQKGFELESKITYKSFYCAYKISDAIKQHQGHVKRLKRQYEQSKKQ